MHSRRRAVAFALTMGLLAQAAYPAPPVPADGGQDSEPAILRIRVLEGEGSIHTAGTRSSQPIVIALTDEAGRPVAGASVSVRLPEDGPTGMFANGMRTEIAVTGADGRVALRGIQWARTAGPVQLRITASKGEARAGILSTQYVTEPSGGAAARKQADPAKAPVRVEPTSRSKWILLAALIGGAAAGGVAAAARGGSTAGGASPSAPPAVTQPTVSIGNPTVTVGRP